MPTPSSSPLKATNKNKPLWPTLLDYGVLIALAVGVALASLYYLTQEQTQTANKPNQKFEDILKPQS